MGEPEEYGEREYLHSDSNKRKLEEDIQLAKQRAQEIVAKLVSNAESKRPRPDYDSPFSAPAPSSAISSAPFPVTAQTGQYHGFQSTGKKISIPNVKVGLIIGKGGETIKYLQLQSGAKIQITKDTEADPYSLTRDVELMGTSDQVSRAEQLINDVLSETDKGGTAQSANHGINSAQPGVEQFVVKVPNDKVALLIGKAGETIKNIQSKSGARVQVIPLRLPPGDTSTERNVYINGSKEQIESAKELINEVISGKRLMNPSGGNSYMQQPSYPPPGNWAQAGQPPMQMQQPQYGYTQPGTYTTPPAPHQYYGNYSSEAPSWDQSNQSTLSQPSQQTAGYNYYGQQAQGALAPTNPSYSYTHDYNQGYSQQPPYNVQQITTQSSSHDQQNLNHNSGYGQSESDGTSSSQSNKPSGEQHPPFYGQPTADPQASYWGYPNSASQPPPAQAGYDQSGYSQTVYGGQQQHFQVPPSQPHSVYGQSGYPPQPPHAQETYHQSEVPTDRYSQPSVHGSEKTEVNAGRDYDSAPLAKENSSAQS